MRGERKRERDISCSPHRKWEQILKMVVPISLSYSGELGEYTWSKVIGLGVELAVKTGRDHFDPWVISWIWVIVLLRKTLSNLLLPAPFDRELMFRVN
jgi:hypothetical protein